MARCCIHGCSNRLDPESKIRMFRFPALLDKPKSLAELSKQRRSAWLKAINRNMPEEALKSIGICSEHFVTGSPSRLKDTTEIDWIPTLKMGKKIALQTQTVKLKKVMKVEKLSELQKLKMELKTKDKLIKSYKDESLQLKHEQLKIVSNYEERLKQKDVKIKMGFRELQANETEEPQISKNHKKGQCATPRIGGKIKKTALKHKLIKPCVVRLRKVLKVKEEPKAEESPQPSLSRRSTARLQITQGLPISIQSLNTKKSPKGSASKERPSLSTNSPKDLVNRERSPKEHLSKELTLIKENPVKNNSPKEIIKEALSKNRQSVNLKPKDRPNIPPSTPTTTKKVSSSKFEESLAAMASTRTRRAPKPNPKYANEDIITPKSKPTKRDRDVLVLNEAGFDTDSGDDFYYDPNETSDLESNDGGAFEINDSSDFSENEDFPSKRKRAVRPVPINSRSNTPQAKQSRPKVISLRPSPAPTLPAKTNEQKKVIQLHPQVMQRLNVATQQIKNNITQVKKRKIEEASPKELPESILARNKRLNIALYDSNVNRQNNRPSTPIRNAPTVAKQLNVTKVQAPLVGSISAPKKPLLGPLSARSPTFSLTKESQKVKSISPPQQKKLDNSPVAVDALDTVDSATTQDDFETMPTFTIVNINDIINKKGDCLVQNREEPQNSTSPSSINRVNRRKTGHTTILSEKIDPVKTTPPLPRTPLPPPKKQVLQTKPTPPAPVEAKFPTRVSLPPPERRVVKKVVSPEKPALQEKPAPRILNSVVAKKTYPVQPILSKLENDLETEPTEETAEKSVMVKENVGANKVVPLKPVQPRKLPPEKVFVQRQGNKLIKKITCFETWYVINIPDTPEPIVKNTLEIPLITLSNAAKTIKLPSSAWSFKVTLYKLTPLMIGKSNLTTYTGDISDQSISEEDRDKYQPSCVMFRRMTQQKSQTRMPYDRAVIFKMKTFFTNIDGKNVRLVGAPSKICSFEEIEVLLELVDELDLLHEFVEPASTV